MNYPTMPALPPAPPEQPKDRRRQLVVTAVGLVTCGAFFTAGLLTGMAVEDEGKVSRETTAATTADPVEEPDVVAEEETESGYTMPEASDFTIELKTKSKQCFGSAGCNVEVEPELSYDGLSSELDPDLTYEITYQISGGDSGPVIETLELTDQDVVSYEETLLSTGASGVEPKAKVTDVSAW